MWKEASRDDVGLPVFMNDAGWRIGFDAMIGEWFVEDPKGIPRFNGEGCGGQPASSNLEDAMANVDRILNKPWVHRRKSTSTKVFCTVQRWGGGVSLQYWGISESITLPMSAIQAIHKAAAELNHSGESMIVQTNNIRVTISFNNDADNWCCEFEGWGIPLTELYFDDDGIVALSEATSPEALQAQVDRFTPAPQVKQLDEDEFYDELRNM